MSEWQIFHGTPGSPHDEAQRLGDLVPPWRRMDNSSAYRAQTYIPSKPEIDIVNAALYLRRPLLLTGPTGFGKVIVGLCDRGRIETWAGAEMADQFPLHIAGRAVWLRRNRSASRYAKSSPE